jgi:cytochrome subunit of sulfide dehydrogenase
MAHLLYIQKISLILKEKLMRLKMMGAFAALVGTGLALAQTPAPPAPAPHPNLARNLAAQCANCHGTDGKSDQAIPSLAGRPAAYNIAQMKAFKEGTRTGAAATIMHQIAKGYSDEQIALMAAWFEKQK